MVKPGYKQTDVGEIPEDWECKSLDEVCSMKSGMSITNAKIKDGELYPCYGGNGLRGFTNKFTHDGEYALVGRQGALCGNVLGVKGKFFASEHAIVFTPFKETDIRWLTFFLHRMNLNQYSESSAQPGLSVNKLKPLKVAAPNIKDEQSKIAKVLSDVDELIVSLEKLIAKKQEIKTGAMQQLLTGKKRLPGFGEGKGYKQTELGQIPEDWDMISLREYVSITSGESPSKFQMVPDGVPYFKVEQLNNDHKYAISTPYYINIDKTVKAGSIIFPKRGASILLNKIRILLEDSYMDTNLMTLTVKENLWNEYLFYCLIYQGLDTIADTTSIPQINNKHINPYKIVRPDIEEQKAISAVLSDLDIEIDKLQVRLDKIKAIKQGMMQELLTGRTRLV